LKVGHGGRDPEVAGSKPVVEPESITLNVRGEAYPDEIASVPASEGIPQTFFLSQPALFLFPRAAQST